MSVQEYFKQSVTVERYTESVGSTGAVVRVWTSASTTDCLISPGGGNESFSDGKVTLFASHRMYCPASVDITNKDRVAHGTHTYRVLFVKDPNTLLHHYEVFLDEVK